MRHIIVTGNPIDGLYFYGPYESAHAASEACERYLEGNNAPEYWVASLTPAASLALAAERLPPLVAAARETDALNNERT